jgi:hypothetical protein
MYFYVAMPSLILGLSVGDFRAAAPFAALLTTFAVPASFFAYGYQPARRIRLAKTAIVAGWITTALASVIYLNVFLHVTL